MMRLWFLAFVAATSASDVQHKIVAKSVAALNPISRVVELMRGLSKKIEADGKQEQELWDKYVCWYQTVKSEKTATNKAAEDRVAALESYVDDIESGKVEFTNERANLEKEVAALEAEVQAAEAIRTNEKEEFDAAKEEMDNSIAALESAVETLGEATAGHEEGVFMIMNKQLRSALRVGKSFLNKQDTTLLAKALDGDVPKADWKKLNKDNTHNKKYKARSGKIQTVLQQMLETFQDNLADAVAMEAQRVSNHDTLSASKRSQLEASKQALTDGNGENGAKALNKQEASDEIASLNDQISRDEKFISEAESSFASMESEWRVRKTTRSDEVGAISQAIAILSSDDARDISSKSRGFLFLQEQSAGCATLHQMASKASAALKKAAKASHDMRLVLLASKLMDRRSHSMGHFDAVVGSIETMMSDLNADFAADLRQKDTCESDRSTNSREAKVTAQQMDDKSNYIARKQARVEELDQKIKKIEETISELNLRLEEAQVNRNSEKAEYEGKKADDQQAKALIKKAQVALESFYDKEGIALLQKRSILRQAPEIVAGEAPPPPPATFSKPYGGATGEANGIQSILEMIYDDIEKDIEAADTMEDEAISDYNTFKSETAAVISDLNEEKAGHETSISEAQGDITDAQTRKANLQENLDDVMAFLKSIAEGCDFIAVNFDVRRHARNAEVDGLFEAKAGLQGGSFEKPAEKESFLQSLAHLKC